MRYGSINSEHTPCKWIDVRRLEAWWWWWWWWCEKHSLVFMELNYT